MMHWMRRRFGRNFMPVLVTAGIGALLVLAIIVWAVSPASRARSSTTLTDHAVAPPEQYSNQVVQVRRPLAPPSDS